MQTLDEINRRLLSGREALLQAKHLFLTFGTAVAYKYVGNDGKSERIVANCHKLPNTSFKKQLISIPEIVTSISDALLRLKQINPEIHVTFTVSPIRHFRASDGPIPNSRSKAHLLAAAHEIIERLQGFVQSESESWVSYFPSYEIMMDDLRDYRFYGK